MSIIWLTIHIVEIILWVLLAVSGGYILFFALASLLRRKISSPQAARLGDRGRDTRDDHYSRFLVLFPAYHEDKVIVSSVRSVVEQAYPYEAFHVCVISDHMSPETNDALRQLPITLLTPVFDESSKARAMQYAMEHVDSARSGGGAEYDYVVILDADNVVGVDFLGRLNEVCHQGDKAIQCHRCAKNSDNDIAVLDGISEEINNTIFRMAHNSVGLSSALIGSGMCLDYQWFSVNVRHLSTAGEDRELEELLLRQRIHIHYAANIPVFDEKVSNRDNFQRQRLRWMTAQVQSLLRMLPYVPQALMTGNIDYIDKTIQQALVPRSMLIVLTFVLAVVVTLLAPVWGVKWWLLFLFIGLALYVSTPRQLRSHTLLGKLASLPPLVGTMLLNILKIDRKNTDFQHTKHG